MRLAFLFFISIDDEKGHISSTNDASTAGL